MTQPKLSLVEFDQACLDKSWHWLNDPEIRALTLTPPFTRADQISFFKALPKRTDYVIWGVAIDEGKSHQDVIGCAGLKNHRRTRAEYWGYIGEKRHWGKGLGRQLLDLVEQQARARGFEVLDLVVGKSNIRAFRLYRRAGYTVVEEPSEGEICLMTKHIGN
jgi:RimJ/RimL family protein N-acetyltransferase